MQSRSAARPHVTLSAAMSVDGYIDDATGSRLILSGPADLNQVDELRAASDAILVGAQTIRSDNPALLVKSGVRRDRRVAEGRPASPLKVTVTRSGELDPRSHFFTEVVGEVPVVYAPAEAAPALGTLLPATVVGAPFNQSGDLDLVWILAELVMRGVQKLLVEGGAGVLARFVKCGLADELRLAIAPIVVADANAPRLLALGRLRARMQLAEVAQVGEMAVLRYLPSGADAPVHSDPRDER
jgi:5-amino-6-(5-phosphoribosylamino)uracil reductase